MALQKDLRLVQDAPLTDKVVRACSEKEVALDRTNTNTASCMCGLCVQVLLRCDHNCDPRADAFRVTASLPTLAHCLARGATLIICTRKSPCMH